MTISGYRDQILGSLTVIWAVATAHSPAAEPARIEFEEASGEVTISVSGEVVATYVYDDDEVRRPYLANLRAPGGIQVTRNHPPVEGVDSLDHATYHPGIWMSFGDLGGSDYWRNQARVVHERFLRTPTSEAHRVSFTVRNLYRDQKTPERVVCREDCRIDLCVLPAGYFLLWDSTFSSDERPFAFGDQEEMGLGVRVATAITEQNGGTLRDAAGRTTAKEIWGKSADWCDYSGTLDNKHVGVTLFCHPENFRPSWLHARDYGLLAANAFGREAFGQGPASSVAVKPGESLRLRYGVLLHASPVGESPDIGKAFEEYVELASQ